MPFWEAAQVRVTPLGAAELREAIEKPAERAGLKFEHGVVQELLDELLGEPAGLPLLEFTLLKLWERREHNRVTLAAYRALGGGLQALARSADELYDSLIPEEQVTVKRILLRLVRPGDGLEVTSNRVRRDVLDRIGEDPGRVSRVLVSLTGAGLVRLTPGDSPDGDQVEVAHEALVRNWQRLVAWLDQARFEIATGRRLQARAEEWLRLGRSWSDLLNRQELDEAESWLKRPEAKDLGDDGRLAALVTASRRAIDLRARSVKVFAALCALALLALAASGYVSRRALKAAENQLSEQQKRVQELTMREGELQRAVGNLDLRNTEMQARYDGLIAQASEQDRRTKEAKRERDLAKESARRINLDLDRVTTDLNKSREDLSEKQRQINERQAEIDAQKSRSQALIQETGKAQLELQEKKVQREEAVQALNLAKRNRDDIVADGDDQPKDELGVLPQIKKAFVERFDRSLHPYRSRQRPLQAGVSVSSREKRSLTGTVCCLVRDSKGALFILSRTKVFTRHDPESPGSGADSRGLEILQPSAADSLLPRDKFVVATVERFGSDSNRSGAIARLKPDSSLTPKAAEIPGLGRIVGPAKDVQEKTEVWLFGRGSGRTRGRIERIDDGQGVQKTIVVTGLQPKQGDTGAPLLTPDHRLVGMLWGWNGKEAFVTPIDRLLADLDVTLVSQESP